MRHHFWATADDTSTPTRSDELLPQTIANVTVDPLLHHAQVVVTTGGSIRLTQAIQGKVARPLTK